MKTKRYIFCIFLCVLAFLCVSCGFFGDQNYYCDIDQVESIQIVSLGEFDRSENRYEYKIISEISNCSDFVDRLNNIRHSVNWGEPMTLKLDYIVINVNYVNGDFDLIHYRAQSFYRSGAYRTGYFYFNQRQFEKLISDYSEENLGSSTDT